MSLKKIIQTIKKNKTFVVATHVGPDPDALGSQMAMAFYLKLLGKKVRCISDDKVPERYNFLPGVKTIKKYSNGSKFKADVMIILDCGDLRRVGKVAGMIGDNTTVINIDHHITNDNFGHINFVDAKASSTCEILYKLFSADKVKVTDRMALHLYAGIMTDTGSFRFENTTPKTLRIAADLREFKFSATNLYKQLYESIPLNDVLAFTKVINGFEALYQNRVACVRLSKRITSHFSQDFDLRDTIFKFLRSINGIEVFVIFTEVSRNKTRVNFRSSGLINVAKIAHIFDGGGHKNASGGVIACGMNEASIKVLKEIKKVL